MAGQSSDVAKLRALLETAVDAIITIDTNAAIQSLNPAAEKIFGFDVAELVGKNVSCLMPEPWASEHDDYIQRYLQTGKKRIIGIGREVEGLRKDRTVFPMHLSVGEYEVKGETFYTGIIHDLTRRKRVETALVNAQKMEAIGHLTGGMAHDFNNLLTVITGNMELLEMKLADDSDRELVNEALEAAQLGADLTERLLTFARRTVLEPQTINLNRTVESLSGMLARTLGGNIALQTMLADDLWTARVDPGQVENALLNLTVNARDAMPDGGRLVIETSNVEIDDELMAQETDLKVGHYVCISVSDAGEGMETDTLDRVFEPFFTTKGIGKGSGLGLSMVYGFAKQSGGRVAIYSEIKNGTTVNLYLPREYGGPIDSPTTPPAHDCSDRPVRNALILVVEDDERVMRITLQRLQTLGHRTIDATDGVKALEILEKRDDIDLVFTDLVMPGGISGYRLAEIVKERFPRLPVLMTSGYAEDLVHADELASRSLKLLRKPYKIDDLAALIKGILTQPS